MLIEIKYSEDSMWGDTDTDGYDIETSYSNFERELSGAVLEVWPGAKVEFDRGLKNSHIVDGDVSSDDSIRLGEIINRVWEKFDWAV